MNSKQELDLSSQNNEFFDNVAIGIAYINTQGRFLKTNRTLCEQLGYKEHSLNSIDFEEIMHPDDHKALKNAFTELLDLKKASSTIYCNCFNAKGEICKLRVILSVIKNSEGNVDYFVACLEVLNSQTESDTHIQPSFERKMFETIAKNVPTTVWLSSVDLKTLHYANQAFFDIWQVPRETFDSDIGYNIFQHIHPDDVERVQSQIQKHLKEAKDWEQNFRILHKDGSVSFIEDHGTVLCDDSGNALYLLGTHHDVTERVEYTAKLETLNQELQSAYEEVTRLNQVESLTGCHNRSAMLDQLSNAYYQFTRYEIPSTIIFIDLNRFKEVNDVHGHIAGDLVLKNFVKHMQKRIRQTDILGRLGGDEFLLLFPGTTKYKANQFLKKEKQEFKTMINDEQALILSYSVGIAELDFKMNTIDEWVDAADKLMYKEKALSGQN